jgi:hypothetical protein
MSDLMLRRAVAMRLMLTDALERGKAKRANASESGEILSQLLLALGLVVLATAIVAGVTLWATGKLGDLTAN